MAACTLPGMTVHSFPPVADPDARVLILGSMPGTASLAADEYYAHPRNLFWPIMGELIGAHRGLPYAERLQRVRGAGIALWETLASCVRPGSLDSAIERESIVVNDFAGFYAAHPQLRRVCFNGAASADIYRRHVLPTLPAHDIEYLRLPSTSPAHASLSFERKLQAWRQVLAGLQRS